VARGYGPVCWKKTGGSKTTLAYKLRKHEPKLGTNEKIMTIDDGGEIKEAIKYIQRKTMFCSCGKIITLSPLIGYPHSKGHSDKNNKKWWTYVRCPFCGYEWSLWKIYQHLGRIVVQSPTTRKQDLKEEQ